MIEDIRALEDGTYICVINMLNSILPIKFEIFRSIIMLIDSDRVYYDDDKIRLSDNEVLEDLIIDSDYVIIS